MDKEMIVTALRCDSSHISCNECSYYIRDNLQLYCDYLRLDWDAADLIEAQAAEIERLTAERDTTEVTEPLTPERFEEICEAVHNGWQELKVNQGVTDHPDMKPYADLAETTKDYDRATVCRVLDALGIAYRQTECSRFLMQL